MPYETRLRIISSYLLLGAEVTIAIEVMDDGMPTLLRGRADWACDRIWKFSSTSNTTPDRTGNLLIVAEAKGAKGNIIDRRASASASVKMLGCRSW